jgi:hypothetical protein
MPTRTREESIENMGVLFWLETELGGALGKGARKAIVHLNTPNGKVRTQALCIARSHVRIKNLPKEEG